MTAILKTLTPSQVADRVGTGRAVLIDVREADEFARRHIKGAFSRPLSGFEQAHLGLSPDRDVIFTCRSGMRTTANYARLAARVDGEAYVLEGGLDAWTAAGLPVEQNRAAPLEMIRQVQIAAGLLVVAGVVFGVFVHPAFLGLAGFVGAGLIVAGVTGFCGMAKVLARAPWNRGAA